MAHLIVQADDVGITRAATLGTIDSIADGIVRNAGLFTNRPDSAFAAQRLREFDHIDVGIDINLVTGEPVLPAADVAKLVDSQGRFRSSGSIRSTYPLVRQKGLYSFFETDPFDYDQSLAEARTQVERFGELMGRAPAYIHHHSVVSQVIDEVLHEVAAEFGLLVMDDLHRFGKVPLIENHWYRGSSRLEAQAEGDPLADLESLVTTIAGHDLALLILHPGYMDAELLGITTMTLSRVRDVALATSREFADLLQATGIELVSYSEIVGDLDAG